MSHALTGATYGSDKAGLVCAYAFTPGEAGRALDSDEAAAALTAGDPARFLWLHFSLANTAAARWLRQHEAVPDAFFERARQLIHASRSHRRGADGGLQRRAVLRRRAFVGVDRRGPCHAAPDGERPDDAAARHRSPARVGQGWRDLRVGGRTAGAPASRSGRRAGRHRARRDAAGRRHRGPDHQPTSVRAGRRWACSAACSSACSGCWRRNRRRSSGY